MDSPNAVREFCDAVCKGWWIYMGADRDEFVPEIYRFTYTEGVGRAFYSEENYYIAEEHGEADHDPWSITEGCAMLTAGDGRDHRIILDDSEHMRLIAQDSGETRPFSRSSAPEAIEYLEQSELYYLADYPPEEVFVSLREDYGEDLYFDIYRAVYVREDDTELIEKYGLKDAFFDNGIEIVPSIDEDAHINLYAFTRDTEYYLCDWESDSPALTYINCPWEEFFEALQRNDGLMRVEIKTAEGIITMMREVYMP